MFHDIDLILTLVGSEARDISADGVPVLTPMLDIANARVTFNSGAVANITSSRISRERKRKIRIFQQSGYLSLDLAAGTGEFFRLRSDIDPLAIRSAPADILAFVERIKLDAPDGEPLRLELESFVSARRGKSPRVVTGDEGRMARGVALHGEPRPPHVRASVVWRRPCGPMGRRAASALTDSCRRGSARRCVRDK